MLRSWKFDVALKKCGSWHGEAGAAAALQSGRSRHLAALSYYFYLLLTRLLLIPHRFRHHHHCHRLHHHHHCLGPHGSKQSVVEHISGQTNHGATGFQRIIWPRTNKPRMTNCAALKYQTRVTHMSSEIIVASEIIVTAHTSLVPDTGHMSSEIIVTADR